MKHIYISYKTQYEAKTKQKVQTIEKHLLDSMLNDTAFSYNVITEHYRKQNALKVRKIIKLLLLNLIRSITNESGLIISLDKCILSKNKVPYRLFIGVINKLDSMGLIIITKGYFLAEQNKGKRTSIIATEQLKNIIIKHVVSYTEQVQAELIGVKQFAEQGKVKLTFKSISDDRIYAKFVPMNSNELFARLNQNRYVNIKVNNQGRITGIF